MSIPMTERAPGVSGQRWFLFGLAVILVAVSVQYALKARDHRSAIVRWQSPWQQLDEGQDIYQRYIHPNSPMLVLLLKPLAQLPPLAAALGWFYAKLAMAGLAIWCAFRLVESRGQPFPPSGKALAVALSLRPILGDLTHGNVNLLILFLVLAALYAFRQRQDAMAGLVLALAIACKVTPALFVPYFLWKRAWKTLAGCALGLGLFLWPGVVPGWVMGGDKYTQMLQSWSEQMIKPYLVSGAVFYSEHGNQSLPGLLTRLATHSPSDSKYIKDLYTPLAYHNLLSLDAGVVRWLIRGCAAGFAGLVVWSCRTPTAARQGWRLAAEFSLVLLGMLLFSERTWKHHCVTLLLPLAVLCYHLTNGRPSPSMRGYLAGTLAAAALLMALTSSGLWAAADDVSMLAQVYGAYVWAYLVLAAALVVLLRQPSDTSHP